jgi:hypothetical protein
MGFYLGTSINNAGTYVTPYDISVYNGGAWQGVKQIYVNDAGTWRSVYEFWPGIDADTTYSANVTFTSRSFAGANSTGFFRWVNTTDATFTSKGWWTRTQVTQNDGGFFSDTGWQAGSTTTSANQAIGKMWLPTRTSLGGNSSLISVPTLQAQGSHSGNNWYARWNYSGEVTTFNNSLNSVPADWIV